MLLPKAHHSDRLALYDRPVIDKYIYLKCAPKFVCVCVCDLDWVMWRANNHISKRCKGVHIKPSLPKWYQCWDVSSHMIDPNDFSSHLWKLFKGQICSGYRSIYSCTSSPLPHLWTSSLQVHLEYSISISSQTIQMIYCFTFWSFT